ncbi:MAG: pteridine reductase [Luteimonas sp.]
MFSSRPVALVTGAARRIGAGVARRLHAEGYDLSLHYRDSAAEMVALIADLNAHRADSAMALQADLVEFDRLPELIATTIGRFGRLDALVNNASGFFPTPFGQATPQQWDALFAANARAPFFLSQAAAPHLKATHGAIVNIADIHAERPLRDHAIYGMSKAALVHMTHALAAELAPDVRVNAVSPGAILWPDTGVDTGKGKDDKAKATLLARTPMKRTGTVEEIAEAVRWLLHDASYTTGQVIRVDGGRLLES